jgi:hypothetical protein
MIVHDNFLSEEEFNSIKEYILGSKAPKPHWYYGDNSSYTYDSKDLFPLDTEERIRDTWAFNRDIFNFELNYGDNEALQCMSPIMKRIIEINGPDTKFKRIRFHMKCFNHGFKESNYNPPHVDYNYFPHKTLILYLNDSDGDTYFFNESFDGITPIQEVKFTVKDRVSPKANRAILFDGYQYHAGSNPLQHDTRVLINMNYV